MNWRSSGRKDLWTTTRINRQFRLEGSSGSDVVYAVDTGARHIITNCHRAVLLTPGHAGRSGRQVRVTACGRRRDAVGDQGAFRLPPNSSLIRSSAAPHAPARPDVDPPVVRAQAAALEMGDVHVDQFGSDASPGHDVADPVAENISEPTRLGRFTRPSPLAP